MITANNLTQESADNFLKEKIAADKATAINIIDNKLKEFSQTILDGEHISIDIHVSQACNEALKAAIEDYRNAGWFVLENWYSHGARLFSNIDISKQVIVKPVHNFTPLHDHQKVKKSFWQKLFSKA